MRSLSELGRSGRRRAGEKCFRLDPLKPEKAESTGGFPTGNEKDLSVISTAANPARTLTGTLSREGKSSPAFGLEVFDRR